MKTVSSPARAENRGALVRGVGRPTQTRASRVQFFPERGLRDDLPPGRLQLFERGGEEFRSETPSEGTERALPGTERGLHDPAGRTRSKNRRNRSGSLTPGDDSIPLEMSTPQGRVGKQPSDVLGPQPAGDEGALGRALPEDAPVEGPAAAAAAHIENERTVVRFGGLEIRKPGPRSRARSRPGGR